MAFARVVAVLVGVAANRADAAVGVAESDVPHVATFFRPRPCCCFLSMLMVWPALSLVAGPPWTLPVSGLVKAARSRRSPGQRLRCWDVVLAVPAAMIDFRSSAENRRSLSTKGARDGVGGRLVAALNHQSDRWCPARRACDGAVESA